MIPASLKSLLHEVLQIFRTVVLLGRLGWVGVGCWKWINGNYMVLQVHKIKYAVHVNHKLFQ